jgi:4-carboxymuconolactone decarboxylase
VWCSGISVHEWELRMMSLSRNLTGSLATALMSVAIAVPVSAQDRMPPIPKEQMTEAQQKAAAELGGRVLGPFVPLLRSPEVMSRSRLMADYLRSKSVLPPRLSELVILLTAREWTQRYEWMAHHEAALRAGLKEDLVKAIAEGRRPDHMSQDEEIIHDFCLELHRNQTVSDATYGRMLSRFGEQGIIDTIGITGFYTFLAMVMNTTRTPLPDGGMYPCPAAKCDAAPLMPFPR